jgi:hypothetical protein
MSYSDFKFPDVVERLQLDLVQAELFSTVSLAELSTELTSKLQLGMELSNRVNNEKARSEFVVAPLLFEIWQRSGKSFGLFSGWELSIDADRGLSGVCDYLLTRDPLMLMLRAPIMAIVEAKNDHVRNGFGQCIASMLAARLFNERHDMAGDTVYGAATTGVGWHFMSLSGNRLIVDSAELQLMNDSARIAGILMHIVAPNKGNS